MKDGADIRKIQRITFKKNYASSMQSHKMGGTAALNDLYFKLGLGEESDGRIAVYQDPFYGFLKEKIEGTEDSYTYRFIGLYTGGPDKGDKPTMGYDKSDVKPNLISMEGLDHNIKGVGFDYPWAWMKYVADAESLCVDKGEDYEKAWEIGSSGSAKTEAAIQEFLDTEFRPAYEAVYNNHTLVIGLSDDDYTAMLGNPEAFGQRKDANGRPYQHFEFYRDGVYELYSYNRKTNAYAVTGVNIKTQTGVTDAELEGKSVDERTAIFRAKRLAKFKSEVPTYFDLDSALFTWVAYLIFGIKDNDKKNSYLRKTKLLADGGKYVWWHDDVDTMLDIENQGLAIINYYVLRHDFTDASKTAYVFKGEDSYFWYTLSEAYWTELKAMGKRVMQAMYDLSTEGAGTFDRLLGFFKKYFWSKAQGYFSKTAYNADAEYAYEEAWPHFSTQEYAPDVHPLYQSLGDHYEAEYDWVAKRMIFCASLFGFGPFANYNDASLGVISFRTQLAQNFKLTPALAMYPAIISGQGAVLASSERIMPGESVTISGAGGTNTNVYIMAADYLSDIGDLCTLAVDSAAGASISIGSKRLRKLKLGDETADNVTSNLAAVNMGRCDSLESIDARNLSTLSGALDLSRCPRLKDVYLEGTDLRSVAIADGAKVETLHLPDTLTVLTLRNLKMLSDVELGTLEDVESLWFDNTPAVEPLTILRNIYNTEGQQLSGIRILGLDADCTTADIEMLANIANDLDKDGNPHAYNAIAEDGSVTEDSIPFIEGKLHVDGGMYEDDIATLKSTFANLEITAEKTYVRFKDATVGSLVATKWGDGTGATKEQLAAVTDLGTTFKNNTTIETFDEFELFEAVTLPSGTNSGVFHKCTGLKSIKLPKTLTALRGTGNYVDGHWGTGTLYGCSALESIDFCNVTALGDCCLSFCRSLATLDSKKVQTIGLAVFESCTGLTEVTLREVISLGQRAFTGCTKLRSVLCHMETPPTCGATPFENCSKLSSIYVPDDSVEAYKTATNWSTYASKIKPLSQYVEGGGDTTD